ncbi:hypothetical protein C8J57DRAFT_1534911 [Mycena rebaudengoi]|nr:hypothetical protein C8J57DRAFT_1534911 [Mycena rebaudengoi]
MTGEAGRCIQTPPAFTDPYSTLTLRRSFKCSRLLPPSTSPIACHRASALSCLLPFSLLYLGPRSDPNIGAIYTQHRHHRFEFHLSKSLYDLFLLAHPRCSSSHSAQLVTVMYWCFGNPVHAHNGKAVVYIDSTTTPCLAEPTLPPTPSAKAPQVPHVYGPLRLPSRLSPPSTGHPYIPASKAPSWQRRATLPCSDLWTMVRFETAVNQNTQ